MSRNRLKSSRNEGMNFRRKPLKGLFQEIADQEGELAVTIRARYYRGDAATMKLVAKGAERRIVAHNREQTNAAAALRRAGSKAS